MEAVDLNREKDLNAEIAKPLQDDESSCWYAKRDKSRWAQSALADLLCQRGNSFPRSP
jgi:hypothetical protein